jgi:hypothetical protein
MLEIRWPGAADQVLLKAIIVAVPAKLRLTVARMRELAHHMGQVTPKILPDVTGAATVDCRFERAVGYRSRAYRFGLSNDGLFALQCGLTLSRYVGLIELTIPDGPLFDVVLDATETEANPAVLALVRRTHWPQDAVPKLRALANVFGATCLN